MEYDVFVPAPSSRAAQRLATGSALVSPRDDGRAPDGYRHCHYEGNLYQACNLQTFGERLVCAAGRAEHRYPTVAQSTFPESDLIEVGQYDLSNRQFTLTGDRSVIEDWIGGPLTEQELSC